MICQLWFTQQASKVKIFEFHRRAEKKGGSRELDYRPGVQLYHLPENVLL